MTLNRNPQNFFAEVEQAAFSPSALVPGIEPSEDKLLQGRLFSYPDTQRHRLGPNYLQIPVNCPYAPVRNHQRDGLMNVNQDPSPVNYEPNSSGNSRKKIRHTGTVRFRCKGMLQARKSRRRMITRSQGSFSVHLPLWRAATFAG